MDKAPLISVIVPVYNSQDKIEICLNSLLSQTFLDFEIIIVNDGSQDRTLDIIKQNAEKDTRIIFVNVDNGGAAKARNIGLHLAKGQYVTFCDSDDYVDNNWLSSFVNCLYDGDLLSQGYKNDAGSIVNMHAGNYIGDSKLVWLYLAAEKFLWGFIWCKLFRMDIIHKYNIKFNEKFKFQEDLCFVLRYLLYCQRIVQIPVYAYTYCCDDSPKDKYKETPKFCSSIEGLTLLRLLDVSDSNNKKKRENYFLHMMICDIFIDYQKQRLQELTKKKYECLHEQFPSGLSIYECKGLSHKIFALISRLPFPLYNKLMIFFVKIYKK